MIIDSHEHVIVPIEKQLEMLNTAKIDKAILSLEETITMPVWVHTFHPVTNEGIKILMGLCKKYSNIPVIFGHLGGVNWIDVIKFAKEQKNVYLDLSAAYASIATKTALVELPERCLFSSDAPFLFISQVYFLSTQESYIVINTSYNTLLFAPSTVHGFPFLIYFLYQYT